MGSLKLILKKNFSYIFSFYHIYLICRRLEKKKFLLLLDDIWERLDLNLVGIPLQDDLNESKVIFTTQLEEVCGLIGA